MEKIQTTGFYLTTRGKTEEEKERGILQPLIHQEKGQTQALYHFTYFYILKVNQKWISEQLKGVDIKHKN